MPIDIDEPLSDGWWLNRLARKLQDRQPRLDRLHRYLSGDPTLPVGAENARRAYQAFQRKARLNVAELIVEATRERMTPTGFRTSETDEIGDAEARRIWDENDLDVESADVHESMLAMGDGYVIIGPPEPGSDVAVITGEDPRQVVTIHDPVRQRRVRAAAKLFHDPDLQRDYAYLYMPRPPAGSRIKSAYVRVASRDVRRTVSNPAVRFNPRSWDWDDDRSGELPIDVAPVVRFRNRKGVGEFEPHIDLLDRINHMILQRMVIATFQAFKQRAIKGAPATDPDTGEEIEYEKIFEADPGAIWLLPGAAEMWESGQVDLTPILSSVKDDLQQLAAVSRTQLTYMIPDAANQSAEGASLMREGQVFKAEDRIKRASSAWIDTMHIADMFGARRWTRGSLQMLWAPVERYSLAERADAASKAGDLPWRTKMIHIWQFSPAEVARMEAERAADVFLAGLAAPELEPAEVA